jgi:hypothetical protein
MLAVMRRFVLRLVPALAVVACVLLGAPRANTCADYPNQAAAQRAADTRDADGDGIYCESLPCPCLRPGKNGSGGSGRGPARRPRLGPRQPLASVAVAAVGVREGLVGTSLGPRESIAAAVALTGHAVIAPEQAPLDGSTAPTGGDAAAVPLAEPGGAVAVARLGAGQRLTVDDLRRLRAILRRLGVECAGAADQPSSPRGQAERPTRST